LGQPEGAAPGSEKGPHPSPEATPRLRVELLLVWLNRSPCSISVNKVHPFSVPFRAFLRFLNFDLRLP
jgi:hypothetical protein